MTPCRHCGYVRQHALDQEHAPLQQAEGGTESDDEGVEVGEPVRRADPSLLRALAAIPRVLKKVVTGQEDMLGIVGQFTEDNSDKNIVNALKGDARAIDRVADAITLHGKRLTEATRLAAFILVIAVVRFDLVDWMKWVFSSIMAKKGGLLGLGA